MGRVAYRRNGVLVVRGSETPAPVPPPGSLYAHWFATAGKTVDGGVVDAWTSTAGDADPQPYLIALISEGPIDGADFVEFEYGDYLPEMAPPTPAAAFASVDEDNYVAFCGVVTAADDTAQAEFVLALDDYPAMVILGYLGGSAVVGYYADMTTPADSWTLPNVLAQTPVTLGDVFICEIWSDGANIKARINGGDVESVAWVGNKWPSLFTEQLITPYPVFSYTGAGPIVGRAHEWRIWRDGYPGDAGCAAWRASCGVYGYAGG